MTNGEIAIAFEQVADLLEFQNANPFRVRAYRNGARRIGDFTESLEAFVAAGKELTEIDGVGKDLADKIRTMLQTGRLPLLDELQAQIPHEVLALLRIPGLGPKKAAILHKDLGIQSLDMLRLACLEQRVRQLKGFGAKTEEQILAGIELAATAHDRIYWAAADDIVASLLAYMRQSDSVTQIEVAGSFRRGRETIGDLDFLVESPNFVVVMDRLAQFPGVHEVVARGDTKMTVRLISGLQVDLRVVPSESFGAALQYFTGSKEHNVQLRGMAKERGLRINEWGVYRVDESGQATGESVAGRTEIEVYAALDLPWFPPEIREARFEFAWAAAGDLPRLVESSDIQGDLHLHTNATDGKATLEEMVEAAQARGLKYIAVTDHSQRVSMARGLNAERLRMQWAQIDQMNADLEDFLILKGIECDILEAGGMDLPDDLLAEADWVIASLHYGQNQPRTKIMSRLIGAIEHPFVSVIAHPTGRLINRREPYAVAIDELISAAAENGKLLELNANPARLDLNDLNVSAAKRRGVSIVISSDAHSTSGLDVLKYGILQARRGGLTRDDVANTRSWDEVKSLVRRD